MGTVFSAKTLNPTEITRIARTLFGSKEEAIQHGQELAKRWVDQHGAANPCNSALCQPRLTCLSGCQDDHAIFIL